MNELVGTLKTELTGTATGAVQESGITIVVISQETVYVVTSTQAGVPTDENENDEAGIV
jgi:hypothetical protein